mgnify:CR=1 FL=1
MPQRGFTLLELLVVLVLVGMIAGMVGPRFIDLAERLRHRNEWLTLQQRINGLPMEVLYLDIEEKVNKDLKDLHESIELTKKEELEKAKQKEQKDKEFKALVESIRSKLTPEELKIVKFVNKSKK